MTPESRNGVAADPARTLRAGFRRVHPLLLEIVVATVITVISVVFALSDHPEASGTLGAADIAAIAAAFALVLARRRSAAAVLALALAALVWSMAADVEVVALQAAGLVAMYTVASTTSRVFAWAAGSAAALVLFSASIATSTSTSPWYDEENVEMVAWLATATATGDVVRTRRAYLAAVEERAERAERGLEEEARRRVIEERLRIARELHDVVAHHIAVINVQAGVAANLLDDDPGGARDALDHVRREGRGVLSELREILSVLRQPDDPSASVEPIPSMEQLEDLVSSFDAAGLGVDWRTEGVHRPLTPALGLTGYRIVQESLTNAHKHGTGAHALLRVDYRPGALSIEVINHMSTDRSAEIAGHGIVGMRERVAAMGGTLDVGYADGGRFRVHAVLPVPVEI